MVSKPFKAYLSQVHWGYCVTDIGLLLDHPQISNPTLKMFIPLRKGSVLEIPRRLKVKPIYNI